MVQQALFSTPSAASPTAVGAESATAAPQRIVYEPTAEQWKSKVEVVFVDEYGTPTKMPHWYKAKTIPKVHWLVPVVEKKKKKKKEKKEKSEKSDKSEKSEKKEKKDKKEKKEGKNKNKKTAS